MRDKSGQNKDKMANWRHLHWREITAKLGESSASRSEARVQENRGGGGIWSANRGWEKKGVWHGAL